jgi:hypothetical protein
MAKYCRQIVYCKDCIHRPKKIDEEDNGVLILEFPDNICPVQCEDTYYSIYPADDFYCAYGKDKEDKEENKLLRIVIDNTANNIDKVETGILYIKGSTWNYK